MHGAKVLCGGGRATYGIETTSVAWMIDLLGWGRGWRYERVPEISSYWGGEGEFTQGVRVLERWGLCPS